MLLTDLFLTDYGRARRATRSRDSARTATRDDSTTSAADDSGRGMSTRSARVNSHLNGLSGDCVRVVRDNGCCVTFHSAAAFRNRVVRSRAVVAISNSEATVRSGSTSARATVIVVSSGVCVVSRIDGAIVIVPRAATRNSRTLPRVPRSDRPIRISSVRCVNDNRRSNLICRRCHARNKARVFCCFSNSSLGGVGAVSRSFRSVVRVLRLSSGISRSTFRVPTSCRRIAC